MPSGCVISFLFNMVFIFADCSKNLLKIQILPCNFSIIDWREILWIYGWASIDRSFPLNCILFNFRNCITAIIFFLKDLKFYPYLYIYFGNVYSPCLSPCLPACLGSKTHFPTLPMDVWYLIVTVLTKEIDPWKKIPLRMPCAPAARENAFRLLHKPP